VRTLRRSRPVVRLLDSDQTDLAQGPYPSNAWDTSGRLYFDTITHDTHALRYLVERVGLDHMVLAPICPSNK